MERKEITLPQPLLHHCTISSGLFHYLNNFCFPITLQRNSKDENQIQSISLLVILALPGTSLQLC